MVNTENPAVYKKMFFFSGYSWILCAHVSQDTSGLLHLFVVFCKYTWKTVCTFGVAAGRKASPCVT